VIAMSTSFSVKGLSSISFALQVTDQVCEHKVSLIQHMILKQPTFIFADPGQYLERSRGELSSRHGRRERTM
jgi:hypothetical protein